MGPCPRCGESLELGAGALGEDVCPSCAGRALAPSLARRVLEEELGLLPSTLKELAAHFGGRRLTCAACASSMSPITVRGTPIDVCMGCGAAFFDKGELERMSAGVHREVVPAPMMSSRARAIAADRMARDVHDPSTSHYPIVPYKTELDESPHDAHRALWERAMPATLVEGALLSTALVVTKTSFGTGAPIESWLAGMALVSLPLLLSMFVDVDLRSFSPRGGKWRLGLGGKGFAAGFFGAGAMIAAIAVGGTVSTVNAMLAERFPRVFRMKNALAAGAASLAVALLAQVL